MATSQQWRHASLIMAATLVVLLIGNVPSPFARSGRFHCAEAWASCPAGFKDCETYKRGCQTCIANDVNNCGGCGNKCKSLPHATANCSNAHCGYSCTPGWANCDKNWANGCENDVGRDALNCGSSGYKCKLVPYAITKCSGAKCGDPVCHACWANCDRHWADGCEDMRADVHNCGGCGNKCPVTLKGGEATCS